jgi:hypothetical protein
MNWTKLKPLEKVSPNPCLHCPDPPTELNLQGYLAVGFGDAHLERDGHRVLEENDREDWIMLQECEDIAAKDPDHDWRIVLFGPLHGEAYQRQDGKWLCVEQNQGFA